MKGSGKARRRRGRRRSGELTYYAPEQENAPAPAPEPRPDALRGWTVAGIQVLASTVTARHRHWWPAGDIADQHAAAWDGITMHLLTAAGQPSRQDLLGAGLRELARHVSGDRRHKGAGNHNGTANAGAKFAAYWDWHSGPVPDPAEGVTSRLAVRQILAALAPRQREALTALAAYGDYQLAAAAMGCATGTFETHVTRARRAFRVLWHEGETPSRQWRKDKRVYSRAPRDAARAECGTQRAYWQHRHRREHVDQACLDAHNAYNRARYAAGTGRGGMSGSEAQRVEQLLMSLRIAVPAEIGNARRADEECRASQREAAARAMESGADEMLYGGKACAPHFAGLARALALLSFAPGGVRFGPTGWCAAHPHARWKDDGNRCPDCLAEALGDGWETA